MNTAINSWAAYEAFCSSGKQGDRCVQVYKALYSHGEMTQSEIWKDAIRQTGITSIMAHSVNPRLREMEDMGVVRLEGERLCTAVISSTKVATYVLTGNGVDPNWKLKRLYRQEMKMERDLDKKREEIRFMEEAG